MNHSKRDILLKYLSEKDKLDYCLQVIEEQYESVEKIAYYENYIDEVKRTISVMEKENPFLVDAYQVIGDN